MFKAALFDLDGVVLNTEEQYSKLWKSLGEKYHPEIVHFELRIKGMTLVQILDQYFAGNDEAQRKIINALNDFEKNMSYDYIPGFQQFITGLRAEGVKTAVVTSSNKDKMSNVYKTHPEFKRLFDAILTSEDFAKSKPDPDCYLKAAQRFGLQPSECVGFEDSVNGLKAVKAAKMFCVGLATTNPREVVEQYADIVTDNFVGFSLNRKSTV